MLGNWVDPQPVSVWWPKWNILSLARNRTPAMKLVVGCSSFSKTHSCSVACTGKQMKLDVGCSSFSKTHSCSVACTGKRMKLDLGCCSFSKTHSCSVACTGKQMKLDVGCCSFSKTHSSSQCFFVVSRTILVLFPYASDDSFFVSVWLLLIVRRSVQASKRSPSSEDISSSFLIFCIYYIHLQSITPDLEGFADIYICRDVKKCNQVDRWNRNLMCQYI
jgi:hypothetical protein